MSESATKRSYKDTLNLPKTAFAMKANLVQNEPASLKRWQQAKLYQQVRQARQGSPRYVFHDGPPYANGSIHLGHLLNKCLKDFVVRSRTMMGFDVPYIPGWDCHGLPIEHKVMTEARESGADLSDTMKARRKCRAYAEKFVKLQSQQMQRLLTLADYDDPYLTMDPKFEAATLEVFASLVEAGLVYRGLKPVHWSIENQTALADAELEYYDREDTSVYVIFDRADGGGALMIWTTTPWTLPANLAVAVAPRAEYGVYRLGHREVVIAADLAPKVLAMGGIANITPLRTLRGEELVGVEYRHPFVDRFGTRKVVAAEYVTLEDGTGLVHTAPGHGVEDYQTGIREKLDIYCPVRGDGTFDDTAPDWLRGRLVWDANKLVCDHLVQSGHMFHQHRFTHSYPHDWRGKTPVIFRATEQWFVAVDQPCNDGASLRDRAIASTQDVHFVPDWGRNRMRGMLESRPDWCISRQRAWGLPIPAFYGPNKGEVLLTAASVRAVAAVLREKGSDAWFLMSPADLLAKYDVNRDPQAPDWARHSSAVAGLTKSHDIFDVWFESGSSWNACMRLRGLALPDSAPAHTDLYLEGSDQHRGWFQLSLLPSLGATGKPPFRGVLTHGFMVDKDGRKMSKSLGNALEVDELLKNYGADVCRWWVASLNTDNDIKVDESFFKLAGEEYRKVRNTIRFLLSNLYDYEPGEATFDPTSLDAWALGEFNALVATVRGAYEALRFPIAAEAIFHFCNQTLSAVYLGAVKDRLYCDAPGSVRRRRTQAALHAIASGLIRLLAPILPHTSDEAWAALNGDGDNVHLLQLPDPVPVRVSDAWTQVMAARDGWLKAIEAFRQSHGIDNPLDLGLRASAADVLDAGDLADLCMISRFERGDGPTVLDLRAEPRCERSWKRDGTVKQRSDGGMLCDRCAAAIGVV
jgi:isoleucyl-tRNA synthetase